VRELSCDRERCTALAPGKNLFRPARMPSLEELHAVHCEDYVDAFCTGALDHAALRKMAWQPLADCLAYP